MCDNCNFITQQKKELLQGNRISSQNGLYVYDKEKHLQDHSKWSQMPMFKCIPFSLLVILDFALRLESNCYIQICSMLVFSIGNNWENHFLSLWFHNYFRFSKQDPALIQTHLLPFHLTALASTTDLILLNNKV